jgi:hypothetical protein
MKNIFYFSSIIFFVCLTIFLDNHNFQSLDNLGEWLKSVL